MSENLVESKPLWHHVRQNNRQTWAIDSQHLNT